MTRDHIMQTIIEIIQEVMPEADCSGLQDTDTPFSDIIEMDSLDFLDVVMALQKRYSIEIKDTELTNLKDMKHSLDFLEAKLG
ncbi:MAG: acyl carrier protein [Candidatus Magnetominusculus sp. LBB02]|nr:acyl carrier protein [Candidatus Magnetominusculus sp. LBB02]